MIFQDTTPAHMDLQEITSVGVSLTIKTRLCSILTLLLKEMIYLSAIFIQKK